MHTGYVRYTTQSACLATLVVLFFSYPVAALPQWQSAAGPHGGTIWTITANTKGIVYAGTAGGGVFLSTNNGDTWQPAGNELLGLDVRALAVNAQDAIFAATGGQGIFRSVDGGQSWQSINRGLTGLHLDVFSLAIDPANQALFAGTSDGVVRSTDNGENWTVLTGLPANPVAALYIDPQNSALYVALSQSGLFRSTDGGGQWARIDNGFEPTAILSAQQGILLAGTPDGLYFSRDNGATWNLSNTGLTTPVILSLATGPEGEVYAGTGGGGIFRSFDNGLSWEAANTGLTSMVIQAIHALPSGLVFAGSSGMEPKSTISEGIFRSNDSGTNWSLQNKGLVATQVTALVATDKGAVYVGTREAGLFRSEDDGGSWIASGAGLPAGPISVLAFRATPRPELFAAVDLNAANLFRSGDDGKSWQSLSRGLENAGSITAIALHPEGAIWLGTAFGEMYVSFDDGASWKNIPFAVESGPVRSLIFSPSGRIFAAALGYGVAGSDDNGAIWNAFNTGLPDLDVGGLAADAGGVLYAATRSGGVYRSDDDGASWQAANKGLPAGTPTAIAVAPSGKLFVLFLGDGVYTSVDGGQSWQPNLAGLTNLNTSTIAFRGTQDVWLGTLGSGVFSQMLPDIAQDISWASPRSGNWSNPANWDLQRLPGPGDRVFIRQPGTYVVTLDIDATVSGLSIGDPNATGGATQTLFVQGKQLSVNERLTVEASGILDLDFNTTMILQAGLINAGVLNWAGGTISTADTLFNTGTMLLAGGAARDLRNGPVIENRGVVKWRDNFALRSGGGSIWNNRPGSTFELDAEAVLEGAFFPGDPMTFFNAGRVQKTSSTGTAALRLVFVNNGRLDIGSGILEISPKFTQIGGVTRMAGGNLVSSGAIDLQGGRLEGSGAITADVVNGGVVAPGSPTGRLDIRGDYSQKSQATFEVDLAGTVAAPDFDRLVITGQATLAGSLAVSVASQFLPLPGTSFDVLSATGRTGEFSIYSGLDINAALQLQPRYSDTGLSLIAAAPRLQVSPAAIDFGEVNVGEPASASLTLSNAGSVDLPISAIEISGTHTDDFRLIGAAPTILSAGASSTLTVGFTPADAGERTASLAIRSPALTVPVTVTLRGVGLAPFTLLQQVRTGEVVSLAASTSSATWIDFDNDGDVDLFLTTDDPAAPNLLFANQNGTLVRVDAGALTSDSGVSVAATWGDYDNDGDADVFVANDQGQNNFLYKNNGDGTFEAVVGGPVVSDGGFSVAASWADADNDGDLDLFVANRTGRNFLYQNNGTAGDSAQIGTFTRVLTSAVATDVMPSFACNWIDFDNDGDVDLFVANGNAQPNALYRNDGGLLFTRITNNVLATDAATSRAAAWADFDNDGDFDVFVANDGDDAFYRNEGSGTFSRITGQPPVLDGAPSRACTWADLDNDGDLDLLVALGATESADQVVYLNDNDGAFRKIDLNLTGAGAAAQGVSVADLDGDGDLEVHFAYGNALPDVLYTNTGTNNGWVTFRLQPTRSNRSAIGARVEVFASQAQPAPHQIRQIGAPGPTGGGSGQSGLDVLFGVGSAANIDSVVVRWPSGAVSRIGSLTSRGLYSIDEPLLPSGEVRVEPEQPPVAGNQAPLRITPPADFIPSSGAIFFRIAGETTYQRLTLPVGTGALNISLPPSVVTLRGVQYYVVLGDGRTTVTFPPIDPINNPGFLPVRIDSMVAPIELQPETYRMISVPLVLEDPSIDAVLVDDYGRYANFPRRWRLFRWRNLRYREYMGTGDDFSAGTAFWLVTRDGQPFDLPAGVSVSAAVPFTLTLEPGWNQIGNPFAFPVAWRTVIAGGSVQPPVWYDGSEYQFNIAVLQPWEGYFVLNLSPQPVQLTIPPVAATVGSETAVATSTQRTEQTASLAGLLAAIRNEGPQRLPGPAPKVAHRRAAGPLVVQVAAAISSAGLRDTQNYLGFLPQTTDGLDPADLFEAPPIREDLVVSIIDGENRLAGSFRPPGSTQRAWDVEVATRLPHALVEFELSIHGLLDSAQAIYIFDLDQRRRIETNRGRFPVAFSDQPRPRRLRVIIGSAEDAERMSDGIPLVPKDFELQQNYPNPFNPETRIRYYLPEPAKVHLEIFDPLGRRIRTLLEQEQAAGFHDVIWDARNDAGQPVASGVYLYRLQTPNRSLVRKMVYVR